MTTVDDVLCLLQSGQISRTTARAALAGLAMGMAVDLPAADGEPIPESTVPVEMLAESKTLPG